MTVLKMVITGVEICILAIGGMSLLVSLSIATNINLTLPDRFQDFVNKRKHAQRKDDYRHSLLVSSKTAPAAFGAICSYLSNNQDLKCNRKGRQYIQINVQDRPNNFNIPETDADVFLCSSGAGEMVINVQGDAHSSAATAFNVYWDADDSYRYYIDDVQKPFLAKCPGSLIRPKKKRDARDSVSGAAEDSAANIP